MKMLRRGCPSWPAVVTLVVIMVATLSIIAQAAPVAGSANGGVTIVDNGTSWTLDNGIVKATVTKESPDATEVMKSDKDGTVTYKVKAKDAEGKTQIVTIGTDGAVISKHEAKKKK